MRAKKLKMNKRKIYYLNWEKDIDLLSRLTFGEKEYIQLELGENLYNNLCEMIANQFLLMKEITPISSQQRELNKDDYKTAVYSLVYKWEIEKAGLLDAWSELGCRLARSQFFTNGNKRTALLSMISFIHACGFSLKDDESNKILLMKWEKLLLDITTNESEELVTELTKERILLEINYE